MERKIGTVSRGIRTPIIREGDNIVNIVADSVLDAAKSEAFELRDRDIVAVTEAVVARAQGNYASTEQISEDVRNKFGGETMGLVFPILSRNRFSVLLKGIAGGAKKIILMLSYPADEVGNHLVDQEIMEEKGINPWSDILTEQRFRELFGHPKHPFTGMDYIQYYRDLIEDCGCEAEIILANDCRHILKYTDKVLCCDIHSRERSKRLLKNAGAKIVLGLDDILTKPVNGSGYNEDYGLLGTNKATETTVKLFPRNCINVVEGIQKRLFEKCGKHIEVMVYGDGAFKDPVGKIWEFADPVISPAFTDGLTGQPNEIKLKYLADNEFANLSGQELKDAISESIRKKGHKPADSMASQGTTPRRIIDLVGSLCDLTSGSGDKGTPVVLVQGYFDNYTV